MPRSPRFRPSQMIGVIINEGLGEEACESHGAGGMGKLG